MTTTLGDILNTGIGRLEAAGIADARRDAESLLLHLTGGTNTFLFLNKNKPADELLTKVYFEIIARRAAGEPAQYIIGTQEFMGLEFRVDPNVLIPRQDTETLVELAISEAQRMCSEKSTADPSDHDGDGSILGILDMCCGSGAIAISMAHYIPQARVVACDLSDGAIYMTRKNAADIGVSDRVAVFKTDMFSMEKDGEKIPMGGTFDMILSNPPYIATEVIDTLQTEVKDHEPMMALDGGADGLVFYRIIAEEAPSRLRKDGVLILEIGHDQGQSVPELLAKTGKFTDIQVIKDLPGLDRVVFARRA